MCGITGVIDFNSSNSSVDDSTVRRMADVMQHRGPDSNGVWISDDRRCGLGFRRLAIIDLSPLGNQPMTTSDGRYTIVFNGEIYNHEIIRQELIAKGYNYKSRTDTETILYGYIEWGRDVVHKLLGMWGFAIWDDQEKTLFAARDRIGIKPLYYYHRGGKFIFGSEIKAILEHPAVSRELNLEELPIYLNYGMSGNRQSLFRNINKLSAGHRLFLNKSGDLTVERYWSPVKDNPEYTKMDAVEVQGEILRLLRQAIKDRMMSDVPFGVFLSGGIDSSLNVALMYELMDRPIDTYTVGFKELEKYNELQYARQISKLYNTNHHEILIDQNDAFPILESLVWHEDEPNADPVCIPLYFLSKLTRESGTIVIQVGEGSDEQFVGYPWMMREYNFFRTYWSAFKYLPSFARKAVYNTAMIALNSRDRFDITEYFRRGANDEQLYWSGASIFPPSIFPKILNEKYQYLTKFPGAYAERLHSEILKLNPKADYLQRILYVELTHRLAETLLMRVDKIGMAHSIEARVPFLDHRIVEFTMTLPPSLRVPDKKTTKYVLKKAVEPLLPDNIINRRKQGFWAPVNEWFRNDWQDFALNTIQNSKINEYGIFNQAYIKYLFEQHRTGKANYGYKIFNLMSLAMWYDRFFK
jgi:asparagine synthase (glutamine-hydrolysing)